MKELTHALTPARRARARELRCYLDTLAGQLVLPERKFVIFAHYRTGSTLLSGLLNCHSLVRCEGELLLDFEKLRFKKILFPHVFVRRCMPQARTGASGFVLRLDQLKKILYPFHGGPEKFLSRLLSDDWKIVHLKRENHVGQAVSNVVALARGQFHRRVGSPPEGTKVCINPGVLIRSVNWMENTARQEDEILKRIPHLTVIYERDLLESDRHQASADRVFEYLGIESEPATAKHEKIASMDMFECVVNADEIKEALINAGFEGYVNTAIGAPQSGSPLSMGCRIPGGDG